MDMKKNAQEKDLNEDKLYQLIDPFRKRKLVIEIFIEYYLAIYIHCVMEMREFSRYYLLTISIKNYFFSKTSSIVNECIKSTFNNFSYSKI